MQINKINNTNFGASPCFITKRLLFDLEKKGLDTVNVLRMMRDSYVGERITTAIFPDGAIKMNMYSGGDHTRCLISTQDGLQANPNTYTVKSNPKQFFAKLYDVFNDLERQRSPEQRIRDKINGMHPENLIVR